MTGLVELTTPKTTHQPLMEVIEPFDSSPISRQLSPVRVSLREMTELTDTMQKVVSPYVTYHRNLQDLEGTQESYGPNCHVGCMEKRWLQR